MARKKNLIITEKALKMTDIHENIADYIKQNNLLKWSVAKVSSTLNR